MQFGLLGPLMAVDDAGHQITLAGGRQKALLACLLTHPNTPVSREALIDTVWGDEQAPGSVTMLRSALMRLRHALGPEVAARIVACPPGYVIHVEVSELDVLRFEALCRDASAALRTGAWATAADTAAEALALWRGEPLLDVPVHGLGTQVTARYEQLRLQALEDQAEADLARGRHEHLVQPLRDLVAASPLRERFHAQLMLVLARCGRRAEALEVYQHARHLLVEQLGIEPGPDLRRIQEQILVDESEPRRVRAASADEQGDNPSAEPLPTDHQVLTDDNHGEHPQIPVPRQLPAASAWFTGRAPELAALTRALDSVTNSTGRTVMISAIAGTGGIGKTWLAMHWAYQHLDQFPDGQLFVDLHGFGPVEQPVAPHSAVRGFLDALGIGADRIPVDLDAQSALYRSSVAGKRMLIMLDNAADATQVVPLLPGGSTCTVLVTSRRYLASLVTGHSAHHLRLDVLSEVDARQLLAARLGVERVADEPEAVQTLLTCCRGYPLALSIVIGRALAHPEFPLSALAAELADDASALDALDDSDSAASLPAVLSWSVRALTEDQARMFALLGIAPGPDLSLAAAASLGALPEGQVRGVLRELEHASLVYQHVPGRYRMHDLIRLYAADTAQRCLAEEEREMALRRVIDFYTQTAHAVARVLNPHSPLIQHDPPAPAVRPQIVLDTAGAFAWFAAEHLVLLAAQHTAASRGWHAIVWQLAWAMDTFHFRRGYCHDGLATWLVALDAAAHLPEPTARIHAHRRLGGAYAALGRHEEGIGQLLQALALAEHHRDRDQQARTHVRLAWALAQHGEFRPAAEHASQARDLFRALGQQLEEADALNAMGWYTAQLGEFGAARTHCLAALGLCQRQDNPHGEAEILDSLGYIAHHTDRHRQAIAYYQGALSLFRALGDNYQSADTLDKLGHPCAAAGEHEHACTVWREALQLYREQGRDTNAGRVRHQLDELEQRRSGALTKA